MLAAVALKTNIFLIQEEKLRHELALVKGNLTVMSEMLNELIPGQSQQDETELLQVCVSEFWLLYLLCRVLCPIPQIKEL